MKKEERSRLLKVGIFLISTMVIVLVIVFILGRTRSLFSDKMQVHTYFDNINGLIVGAPVRLSGFEIGIVQSIQFSTDLSSDEERCAFLDPMTRNMRPFDPNQKKPKVYIEMNIQKEYFKYIRKDSYAQLSSKGLLGDAVIDIVVGDMKQDAVVQGACLSSEKSRTLAEVTELAEKTIGNVNTLIGSANHLVSSADTLVTNAGTVLSKTGKQIDQFLSDEMAQDLHRSLHSFSKTMEEIEKGHGFAHSVIYDQTLAKNVNGAVRMGYESLSQLRAALRRFNRIVKQIQTGPGTAHSILYKDQLGPLVKDLSHAVKEVDQMLTQVRSGNGVVHSLIYDKDKTNFVDSLSETADMVKKIVKEVDQGQGTIGGLVKDPSVYKSLKRIIKNAQGTIEDSKILTWILRSLNKDKRPLECQAE